MERRERGIFGRIVVFVLSILAVLGLIAMALSVINPYIHPQQFIWTSIFGLSFWVIFFFNMLILLLLVLMWSKKAWIAVLALVISIPGFKKSFSLGNELKADDSIRIMSYNVHYFGDITTVKKDREECAYKLMNMVREKSPDVFCCQEFQSYHYKKTRPQCIEAFAEGAGFPYVYYNKRTNYGGNVIFSKYPIEKVAEDSGFGQENLYGVMVSVDAGEKGKFHVANVHLLSYNITDNELDVLTNPTDRQKLDTIGKSVLRKLNYGMIHRSEEIDKVLGGMPPVEGPVIVCGDFNDTPLSYIYRKMQKAGYVDTFTKVGRGIKPTYARKSPLLRIDYIWANAEVTPLNFKRYRFKASDHYPIILDFSINQQSNTEQL